MKNWLTARELAGLPGFEVSERRTLDKLKALGVKHRARAGRGGGKEYDCSALPPETQRALMITQVANAASLVAASPEATDLTSFAPPAQAPAQTPALPGQGRRPPSQTEKAVADSRVILVTQLLELASTAGTTRASQLLALQLASGAASKELQTAARTANQRARNSAVSDRTLFRWLSCYQAHGWWGLLPSPVEPTAHKVDDDVAATIGSYLSRDPQFRKLTVAAIEVTKKLGRPYDDWRSLYDRTRRALPKVNNVDLIKARHTGAERAAKLPFKRRDTSVLKPLDVWLIDGHTFKAKVRHPDHGAPFAPEVTIALDAATRKIVGWSVSLSENTIAVGDCLRHAVGTHGVPAIVYSDNGGGETGKAIDCPIAGVMARLGSDHRTGIPGHPQGHGLIERSWQTHMIRCARQFGSFQGKDVDAGTFRKVAAELAKEQRAVKKARETGEVIQLSNKAPSWQQFIDAVERQVNEYNDQHRHRSLPKNERGLHMTPAEAWASMLDVQLQHIPSQTETRMLFMPAVLRTAIRGEVVFLNQHYQAPELMMAGVDKCLVRVQYDMHDPAYVMVFKTTGEFVCEAKWNANSMDYFPKPVIEMAREKRVKGIVKRREVQIETALRELSTVQDGRTATQVLLPAASTPVVVLQPVGAFSSSSLPPSLQPQGGAAQAAPGRPFFDTPSARYEWLMQNRRDWRDGDASWLEQYVGGEDYAELREYFASRGIEWNESGFKSAQV